MPLDQHEIDKFVAEGLPRTQKQAVGGAFWSYVRVLLAQAGPDARGVIESLLGHLGDSKALLVPGSAGLAVLERLFPEAFPHVDRVDEELGHPLLEWCDGGDCARPLTDDPTRIDWAIRTLAQRSVTSGESLRSAAERTPPPPSRLGRLLIEASHATPINPAPQLSSDPIQTTALMDTDADAAQFLALWKISVEPVESPGAPPAPAAGWSELLNAEPSLKRFVPHMRFPPSKAVFAALRRARRQGASISSARERDAAALLLMHHARELPQEMTWCLTVAFEHEFPGLAASTSWTLLHDAAKAVSQAPPWNVDFRTPTTLILLECMLSPRADHVPVLMGSIDSLLMSTTPPEYRPDAVRAQLAKIRRSLS